MHGEVLAGAEIGIHRAFAIGRHENKTPCRGRATERGGRLKRDIGRTNIMGEEASHFIILHLADEGGARAERSHTNNCIGGRAARNDVGRAHRLIDGFGLGLTDQPHGAFFELMGDQEIIFCPGENIDNRIAESEHIKLGVGHSIHSIKPVARFAPWGG